MIGLIRRLGLLLLTGALVNDMLLIEGSTWTAMAKIMFLSGVFFLLLVGVPRGTLTRLDWAVMVYGGLLILLGLFSVQGANGGWLSISSSIVIGVIGHFVFAWSSRDRLDLVVDYYLLWVLVSVLLGVVQALTGMFYVSDRVFESILVSGLHRASGFCSDPNYFGLVCLSGLALLPFLSRGKRLKQTCLALFVVGLLLSGSRSSLLVLVSYLFARFYLESRLSSVLKNTLLVLVVSLAVLSVRFLPESVAMVFDPSAYSEDADRNSLQDRALVAWTALEVGMDSPLTGYGLGAFRAHPDNLHTQVSHNTYLELFAESGVLGLLLFMALMAYLVVRLRSVQWFERRAAMTSFVLVFCMMSLFLVTHYGRMMFFMTGVASALVWKAWASRLKHDHAGQ